MGAAPAAAATATRSVPWHVRHLSLDVTLDPDGGSLQAVARVAVEADPAAAGSASSLSFFLNRGFEIASARVGGAPSGWSIGEAQPLFAPDARRVTLSASGRRPGVFDVVIEYAGRIDARPDAPARISPGLTELNLYAAWFPTFEGAQGFDWKMNVGAPATQTVASNGEIVTAPGEDSPSGGPGTRWTVMEGSTAAGDVPLIASPSFERVAVPKSACDLEVLAPPLGEGDHTWLAGEAAWACESLSRLVRRHPEASHPSAPRLRLIVAPREGDGYARPPLVVVPARWFTEGGIDSPSTSAEITERRRRIYHEIAHRFAPLADTHTYDDWINEGLAEHLALGVLGDREGCEAAASYLRQYLLDVAERPAAPAVLVEIGQPPAAIPDEPAGDDALDVPGPRVLLPPISATLRSSPDARLLYYRKGALIFRMLGGLLGERLLDRAVGELVAAYPASGAGRLDTSALLQALGRAAGRDLDWVRRTWIEGAALPDLVADVTVARVGPRTWSVEGRVREIGPRPFHLVVPVEARASSGVVEVKRVELVDDTASISWRLPFAPSRVALDPRRTIPRLDPVVREALALRAVEIQAGEIARRGFDDERSGNFERAMKEYEEAFAIDPRDPFPLYRRGRVLFTLKDLDGALREHHASARVAEESAREATRLDARARAAAAARRAGSVARMRGTPAADRGSSCLGMDDAPPRAWLVPDPDLRSWNWVRIGQIEDLRGRRRDALRAYRKALVLPDLRGAHEEAERGITVPYVRAASLGH